MDERNIITEDIPVEEYISDEVKAFDKRTRIGSFCIFFGILFLLIAGGVSLMCYPYEEWANSYVPWVIGVPLFFSIFLLCNYLPYRKAKRDTLINK